MRFRRAPPLHEEPAVLLEALFLAPLRDPSGASKCVRPVLVLLEGWLSVGLGLMSVAETVDTDMASGACWHIQINLVGVEESGGGGEGRVISFTCQGCMV